MADRTQSSARIAAPPSTVMAVIADVEAYPTWNDEVTAVEVQQRGDDGRPRQVRFVVDAGMIRDDYTLAYTWAGDTDVSWTLVRAGMLTAMDGSYQLRGEPGGDTTVTYRLAVDVRVPVIGVIKRKAEKVIVDRALRGLRERVEA